MSELTPLAAIRTPQELIALGPVMAHQLACSVLSSGGPATAGETALRLMEPAADRDLLPIIGRLAVKCGRRVNDPRTEQFTLEVYMEDLRQYPADIAAAALMFWPSVSKWWPDWCELERLLDKLMVERRADVEALRRKAGLPSLGASALFGGETGMLVRQAARDLGML